MKQMSRNDIKELNLPLSLSHKIVDVLSRSQHSVVLSDDDIQLSPAEALYHLQKIAEKLSTLTPSHARVGICFPNSAAQAIAIAGVLFSGRIPVILSPHLLQLSSHSRLSELKLHLVIAPDSFATSLSFPVSSLFLNKSGTITVSKQFSSVHAKVPAHKDTALILCTSGSQGEPKAVQLSHEGVVYIAEKMIEYFSLNSNSVASITLPLYHTMALNTQFLPTLLAGGRMSITSPEMSLARIFRDIKESEGNFVSLIADMVSLCFDEMKKRDVSPATKVLHVQLAGGLISEEHLMQCAELFPNAKIHKGYGLTEAMRVCMISSEHPLFHTNCVGKIFSEQSIQIRSKEGSVLPSGLEGEVFLKGPNVMLGYDREESGLSADGYLATGDLGHLSEDGYLTVAGRVDSIFKSQGKRIAGWEIEKRALQHSFVKSAKCLPVKSRSKGLRPILFVEANKSTTSINSRLNDFERSLKKQLENYKMPRDILVVNKLPRTPNGKIEKKQLEDCWDRRMDLVSLGTGDLGCRFWSSDNLEERGH